MKLTKIVSLLIMIFTLSLVGFAQDTAKTEMAKPAKKHHMSKKSDMGGEMKGDMKSEKSAKKSHKGKKNMKKSDADSNTEKPAEKE